MDNPVPRMDEKMFDNQPDWRMMRKWWDFFRTLALPEDNKFGTTAQRPTTRVIYKQYFDTTLGYPIWWDGTNWVDATGGVV